MNKKLINTVLGILLIAATAFALLSWQRRYSDAVVGVFFFPHGWYLWHDTLYRFVVRENGTLVAYRGIGRGHGDLHQPNLMWLSWERRSRRLGEEDFRRIAELADIMAEHRDYRPARVMWLPRVAIWHDGLVYTCSTLSVIYNGAHGWPDFTPFMELLGEIQWLSPIRSPNLTQIRRDR